MATRPARRKKQTPKPSSTLAVIVETRASGATLRGAAAAAGVHVATLCRWQARYPDFHRKMQEAHQEARSWDIFLRSEPRPRVRWRRDCPACGSKVQVRATSNRVRFWRCGRWPLCSWASWRPRASRDCRRCGGPRFWSHSRKSTGCDACGVRTVTP